MSHKTVHDEGFKIMESLDDFKYQIELTNKLDSEKNDFDQNKLNEIVLWKVNRYAQFNEELITEINSISPDDSEINIPKTERILRDLIKTPGVQLAMASTILRFRNPHIYQIIDQRVYRIIYPDKQLKLNGYKSDKSIKEQIDLYLEYLKDLKKVCDDLGIPFTDADRILYMADKRINKNHKLNNYG
jgi:hypothetical protein